MTRLGRATVAGCRGTQVRLFDELCGERQGDRLQGVRGTVCRTVDDRSMSSTVPTIVGRAKRADCLAHDRAALKGRNDHRKGWQGGGNRSRPIGQSSARCGCRTIQGSVLPIQPKHEVTEEQIVAHVPMELA